MARLKHKPLQGYKKVSQTPRRWKRGGGPEITDYQYKSRVARKHGWKSYSELDRYKRSQEWKRDWEWSLRTRFVASSDTSWDSQTIRDAYVIDRERARGKNETMQMPGVEAKDTPLGRMLIQRGVVPEDHIWGDSP